jgi:hypothetical protein
VELSENHYPIFRISEISKNRFNVELSYSNSRKLKYAMFTKRGSNGELSNNDYLKLRILVISKKKLNVDLSCNNYKLHYSTFIKDRLRGKLSDNDFLCVMDIRYLHKMSMGLTDNDYPKLRISDISKTG